MPNGPPATSIGVIGAGRLGASLAVALAAAGYTVSAVAARTLETAEAVAAQVRSTGAQCAAVTPAEAAAACDLVFLAVPDAAIEAVATALPWRPGTGVVHTSGATGLAALAAASRAGALTGCLHPLQSFPTRAGDAARFHGIVCGVEGAEPLGRTLERITAGLGATVVRLEGIDRALYHAAAVMAGNDVVALMAAAARAWAAAGLPSGTARLALSPLLVGAAGNVAAHELPQALTGPVARGDAETVARHIEALTRVEGAAPGLAALYAALGRELLRLPLGHPAATAQQLGQLFAARADAAAGDRDG